MEALNAARPLQWKECLVSARRDINRKHTGTRLKEMHETVPEKFVNVTNIDHKNEERDCKSTKGNYFKHI